MKVCFTDLDGVLNSRDWFTRRGEPGERSQLAHLSFNVDPLALARLNRLCAVTGAQIVFSSTWRMGYTLRRLNADFKALGCTARFVGITPELRRQPRGLEIQAWLDEHGPVGAFVILDDDNDMEHLTPYLVRTGSHSGGLTDEHVEQAIALLQAQP